MKITTYPKAASKQFNPQNYNIFTGSSVCDGDSGGGLVFKSDNKWYLRGIVSVGIGIKKEGAVKTCDSQAYSLYTRVSSHMEWVQDVILRVETKKPHNECS